MKVLYIGGTGEISYSCVHECVRLGHDVAVFNRGQNAEPLPARVRRIAGDLADGAAYAALGQETWDVVCQFKAYDLARIERDLAVFAGRCGQYVFISSASAYQKPPAGHRVTEDTPLVNPYWPYSRAKTEMEARLMRWHREGKLPVTIVRPSHTYRRHVPGTFYSGDQMLWRMLQGKPVPVHGDGTSLWVMTHADDFAVPFARLLGNPRALGEAFHITGDEANMWEHIVGALATGVGAQPTLVHVATQTLAQYNPDWAGPLWGDKAWSVWFDNRKVKGVTGDFACRTTMRQGMKLVAELFLRRLEAGAVKGDEKLNALLDRIVEEQGRLGVAPVARSDRSTNSAG